MRNKPKKDELLLNIKNIKKLKLLLELYDVDYGTFKRWLKFYSIEHNFQKGKIDSANSYWSNHDMPIEMRQRISATKKLAPKQLKLIRVFAICPICGNNFETVPDAKSRKLNKKTCSFKCKSIAQSLYMSGENCPTRGNHHSPESISKIMSHRPMNKFEKSVADLLTKNGYIYTFQFYIIDNGICKSYDFKIKGESLIIEADGDFWHGNPNTKNHWKDIDAVQENDKFKTAMALKRGYNIIRIWESDFKMNPDGLINKIEEKLCA